MPTYEYVCKQCGERFDVFQSFSAKPLRTHDVCGGPLQKVFHPAGVVFKGPGFYVTDSRSKSSTTTSDRSASKASGADGKSGPERSSSKAPSSSETDS